jgi:hypothetical protein
MMIFLKVFNLSLTKMSGKPREIKRFKIWTVSLDPVTGSEIYKTRPCLVLPVNEMNNNFKYSFTRTCNPYYQKISHKDFNKE